MDSHLHPARPDERFTADGRRVREVVSYARRGDRLTDKQQRAWDAHAASWAIPNDEAVQGLDLAARFGRAAPLIVEIGSGIGEATAALAAARPDVNVLAFEVWRPGVAAGGLPCGRRGRKGYCVNLLPPASKKCTRLRGT